MTEIEKAKELINTFATADAEKAVSLLAEGYILHNLACYEICPKKAILKRG